MKLFRFLIILPVILIFSGNAMAYHPLITDDTGTQGKGKVQLEFNSEFSYDKETEEGVTIRERGGEVETVLSYGITDNVDVIVGLPYEWSKTEEDGNVTEDVDGVSDLSLEAKWKFFEKEDLSFALKPGISLPTGDEKKGLGNGRPSYGLLFITTKEMGFWTLHFNLGYTHNEYKLEEDKKTQRRDIWHISLASEFEVMKNLKIAGDIGMETNQQKASNTHPAFIITGLIYSINENLDIDAGVKLGLNKPETDISGLAGITLRF